MDTRQTQEELFAALVQVTGGRPDRRGEVHVTCPWCGKEAARGQVHFSFSERGASCFVCGQRAGLRELARLYGLGDDPDPVRRPVARRQPQARPPAPTRTWDYGEMAVRYADAPDALVRWQRYKWLPEETVAAYFLGVGRLPEYSSKCQHERLMVPLLVGRECVGIRARSLGCDCGKWLSPAGSRMILYNGERLREPEQRDEQGAAAAMLGYAAGQRTARGRTLLIVENPVDALMLERWHPGAAAVATLGVSNWRDEWTEEVARSGAGLVVVCYDHDRPGNGGGEAGRRAWLATHERDIIPNGVRLVNRLLEAGVRARLFPWGDMPLKTDIGDLLEMGQVLRAEREGVA